MLSIPKINRLIVSTAYFCVLYLMTGCPSPPLGPRYKGAGHTSPQHGGTLSFYHESDVRSLDPQVAYDELSNMGIKLIFSGILDYDYQAQVVPSLAETLPQVSADGKTYRFTLRKGVRFHNGRELIADDVKWSLEHMLAPETGSPGFTFYTLIDGIDAYRNHKATSIAGIRVLDRYTFQIQLTKPDQTFMHAMAMTFAHPVPKENYKAHPNDVNKHPIGTGPFMLELWEPGVRLVFRRNPHYFQEGKPYVDRMVFYLNLSRDAAVMQFRSGQLDLLHRFTPADYLFFKKSALWRPYSKESPDVNLWGIAMNCQLYPFTNRHVRRAVAFAINRAFWRKARNYRLRITGQPIPPPLLGYDPHLPNEHRYDFQAAKMEMAQAGFPNGLPEPVTMWVGEGETAQHYGELTQADLAKIGIRIELKQVSFPVYLEETGKPKRAQMLMTGWSQDFPDPADFLDILFHSNAIHERDSENRSFYSNPKLDNLLDRARVEPNIEKRKALYAQAQNILVEDAPWAFIWNDLHLELWQPYVKNYHPHPVWGQCYRDVWLDLPRHRVE